MYSLKTRLPDFPAPRQRTWIAGGKNVHAEFTLLPGAVSETVEVTSTAPLVDQTKTDVSTNITPEQITTATDRPAIRRLAYLALA